MHTVGHGWVYEAMRVRAFAPFELALAGSMLFIVYLALFTAVPCALAHRWPRAGASTVGAMASALAWAGSLTLGEWARTVPFNGFSSLSLGYALLDTPWRDAAPIVGVYGLSFFGHLVAASIATAFGERKLQTGQRTATTVAATTLATLVAGRLTWVQAAGAPLSFRLVQGNVSQAEKFEPAMKRAQIHAYVQRISEGRADLVATPETAFPVFLTELPEDTLKLLQGFSGDSNSNLLLGIATLDAHGEGRNSVLHVAPGQGIVARYDKVRLMPFGEYTPAGFAWFTSRLHLALKDLQPGSKEQPPFVVQGQRIGSLVCSEDLVADEGRRWLTGDAPVAIFVNPTNLAWFAGSSALAQRLQMARMRALELGRPVLRVANTGISASIDARGMVVASLGEGREGIVTGHVQGMSGLTPYARFGDAPILFACMFAILAGTTGRRRPAARAPALPRPD